MSNSKLYQKLAARGNEDAKVVADALGAVPSEVMVDDGSEEQELSELQGLQEYLQTLIARAEVKAQAGETGDAAMSHFERGQAHEMAADMCRAAGRDSMFMRHQAGAMGAYRDCANALGAHVNKYGKDCGYKEGYALPQTKPEMWRKG
jgi:hypothetical protein